jgi:type II secretory pathway component PulK
MKKLHLSKGQTIVEAIVVVSVVVLLVTGLIAGTTTSLRASQSGRQRGQATKYAEEGLEYARSLRDVSWSDFQTKSGDYCLGSDSILAVSSGGTCAINISNTEGSFARKLSFSWDGSKMTVSSTVYFPVGTTQANVSLKTYFTQWK